MKVCRWLDSNCGSLVSEATAQPLSHNHCPLLLSLIITFSLSLYISTFVCVSLSLYFCLSFSISSYLSLYVSVASFVPREQPTLLIAALSELVWSLGCFSRLVVNFKYSVRGIKCWQLHFFLFFKTYLRISIFKRFGDAFWGCVLGMRFGDAFWFLVHTTCRHWPFSRWMKPYWLT